MPIYYRIYVSHSLLREESMGDHEGQVGIATSLVPEGVFVRDSCKNIRRFA